MTTATSENLTTRVERAIKRAILKRAILAYQRSAVSPARDDHADPLRDRIHELRVRAERLRGWIRSGRNAKNEALSPERTALYRERRRATLAEVDALLAKKAARDAGRDRRARKNDRAVAFADVVLELAGSIDDAEMRRELYRMRQGDHDIATPASVARLLRASGVDRVTDARISPRDRKAYRGRS